MTWEIEKQFISQQLTPFSSSLFFIPSINDQGISLDIVFEKDSNNDYEVKDIKYEGASIFIPQNDQSNWGIESTKTYKFLTFQGLRELIKEETHIPENKLILNSNIDPKSNNIKYPNYYRILK